MLDIILKSDNEFWGQILMVKVKLKFNKYKTSTLSGLRSESMVTLSLKKKGITAIRERRNESA